MMSQAWRCGSKHNRDVVHEQFVGIYVEVLHSRRQHVVFGSALPLLCCCLRAGNGSAGRHPLSGDGASGGAVGAVAGAGAGAAEGISSMARPGPAAAGMGGLGGMVKSASYSALSGLDGAVTSSLATATDPAAAAAAPVPLGSLPPSARGALRGELTHVHLQPVPGDPFGQHQQQHMGSSFGQQHRGMTRVQSVPQLRTYGSDAGSPTLPPMSGGGGGSGGAHGSGIQGLPSFGSVGGSGYGGQYEQQQWMGGSMGHPQHQHQQQMQAFGQGQSMQGSSHMALKAESAYWAPELSYPVGGMCAGAVVCVALQQHYNRVRAAQGSLQLCPDTVQACQGAKELFGAEFVFEPGPSVDLLCVVLCVCVLTDPSFYCCCVGCCPLLWRPHSLRAAA